MYSETLSWACHELVYSVIRQWTFAFFVQVHGLRMSYVASHSVLTSPCHFLILLEVFSLNRQLASSHSHPTCFLSVCMFVSPCPCPYTLSLSISISISLSFSLSRSLSLSLSLHLHLHLNFPISFSLSPSLYLCVSICLVSLSACLPLHLIFLSPSLSQSISLALFPYLPPLSFDVFNITFLAFLLKCINKCLTRKRKEDL